MDVTKACEICGKEFSRRPSYRARFCSRACKGASQKGLAERKCERCSKQFVIKPSAVERGGGKFCSPECYHVSRTLPDEHRTCLNCLKDFVKRIRPSLAERGEGKYCSTACKAEHSSGKPNGRKTSVQRGCERCGKEFLVQPSVASKGHGRFCSNECWGLSVRGENSPNWNGGNSKERSLLKGRNEYRSWRTAVYERDNFTCQRCGKTGGSLEADHILSWSVFPDFRYELWNGKTLCKPCHAIKTEQEKHVYGRNYTSAPLVSIPTAYAAWNSESTITLNELAK